MNIVIREIENTDYTSVALIWRDVLGFLSATDENVTATYEKMKSNCHYCTFVADVNDIISFTTAVETIAIPYPNGYIKLNGLAVWSEFQNRGVGRMLMERVESQHTNAKLQPLDLRQVSNEQAHMSFTSIWAIKKRRFGSARIWSVVRAISSFVGRVITSTDLNLEDSDVRENAE